MDKEKLACVICRDPKCNHVNKPAPWCKEKIEASDRVLAYLDAEKWKSPEVVEHLMEGQWLRGYNDGKQGRGPYAST